MSEHNAPFFFGEAGVKKREPGSRCARGAAWRGAVPIVTLIQRHSGCAPGLVVNASGVKGPN